MVRRHPPARHTQVLACLLMAVVVLASGCAAETRHKVLTFFFTGVPAPGEEPAKGKEALPPAATALAKKRARREFFVEPTLFAHGPYGAGQCEKCHAVTASKPFRTEAAEVSQAATAPERTSIGPRLGVPLRELCPTCHAEKAYSVAQAKGLWMHGPVATGWCVTCHSPHRATRPYMLLGKNNVELCTGCHRKPDLLLTAAHQKEPEADCLSCHNPHEGKNSFLLKAQHNEWQVYGEGG